MSAAELQGLQDAGRGPARSGSRPGQLHRSPWTRPRSSMEPPPRPTSRAEPPWSTTRAGQPHRCRGQPHRSPWTRPRSSMEPPPRPRLSAAARAFPRHLPRYPRSYPVGRGPARVRRLEWPSRLRQRRSPPDHIYTAIDATSEGYLSAILIPNPPKNTDGRREESGRGVRELQGK